MRVLNIVVHRVIHGPLNLEGLSVLNIQGRFQIRSRGPRVGCVGAALLEEVATGDDSTQLYTESFKDR
eukprot:13062094-Alexandrium_andersonii.AAC.1